MPVCVCVCCVCVCVCVYICVCVSCSRMTGIVSPPHLVFKHLWHRLHVQPFGQYVQSQEVPVHTKSPHGLELVVRLVPAMVRSGTGGDGV